MSNIKIEFSHGHLYSFNDRVDIGLHENRKEGLDIDVSLVSNGKGSYGVLKVNCDSFKTNIFIGNQETAEQLAAVANKIANHLKQETNE